MRVQETRPSQLREYGSPSSTTGAPVDSAQRLLQTPKVSCEVAADAMSMVEAIFIKTSTAQKSCGEQNAASAERRRHVSYEAARANQEKAEEAAKKKSFMEDIEGNMGVMSAVGLVVCPELVAVDLALHETNLTEKLKIDSADAALISSAVMGGGAMLVLAPAAIALRKSDAVADGAGAVGMKDESDFIRADHIKLKDSDVQPAIQYIVAAELAAASLAATGATFGTGAPFILAAVAVGLSASAIAVRKTKCMDGVTGEGSSQEWGTGLEIASIAAGIGSGAAAGVETSTATSIVAIANGTKTTAQGADRIQKSAIQHDVDVDNLEAEQSRNTAKLAKAQFDTIVDALKEVMASAAKTQSLISEAMDSINQTKLVTATKV